MGALIDHLKSLSAEGASIEDVTAAAEAEPATRWIEIRTHWPETKRQNCYSSPTAMPPAHVQGTVS